VGLPLSDVTKCRIQLAVYAPGLHQPARSVGDDPRAESTDFAKVEYSTVLRKAKTPDAEPSAINQRLTILQGTAVEYRPFSDGLRAPFTVQPQVSRKFPDGTLDGDAFCQSIKLDSVDLLAGTPIVDAIMKYRAGWRLIWSERCPEFHFVTLWQLNPAEPRHVAQR
jgi:hypothetical protein